MNKADKLKLQGVVESMARSEQILKDVSRANPFSSSILDFVVIRIQKLRTEMISIIKMIV